MESCINWTIEEIFVNMTCITDHLSILNTKACPKKVWFRQVSLYYTCITKFKNLKLDWTDVPYINNVFLYNFITGTPLKFKVQAKIIRDCIYALEKNKYLQIVKIIVPSRDEFDLMLKDDQFEEPKGFLSVFSKWTQIFIMIYAGLFYFLRNLIKILTWHPSLAI